MSKFIEKLLPWKKTRRLLREIKNELATQKNLLQHQENRANIFEQKLDSLAFQTSMGEKNHRYEAVKQRILRKIAREEKVEVLFMHVVRGTFKLHSLYRLFDQHPAFSIRIIKAPYISPLYKSSPQDIQADILRSEKELKEAGLKYHPCRQLPDGSFSDPLQEIHPDILFFPDPYEVSLSEHYHSSHFPDSLSYYVPYGVMSAAIQKHQYDKDFHMRMYKCFYESKKHLLMAKKYARNKGDNVVASGYPWFDDYRDDCTQDPWKQKETSLHTRKIRIIWAPHHSIEFREEINWSSFLLISEFMLDLAQALHDKVTIAFRPHPVLREKLYAHQDWGFKRTDEYYNKWHTAPGTLFSDEENYISLFKHSDAMILDSVSFLSEYLITGKPMLFVFKGEPPHWNEFGEEFWQIIDKTSSTEGINRFIENILSGKDTSKKARQSFFENALGGGNPSLNIFADICKDLELDA